MKHKNLSEIRAVLHDLLKSLPAIKMHRSQEILRQHLELIAYYQKQYDLLVAKSA